MPRDILIWPEPALKKMASKVTEFDESLKLLFDEMENLMLAARGAGLAAPQIGVLKRAICVVIQRTNPSPGEQAFEVLRLCNPVIVERKGKQRGREGCLSLPGYFDEVERSQWVAVEAQDENGEKVEVVGDKYLARALQHEIDHLEGKVFVDYLSVLKRNLAHAKFSKAKARGMRYSFADAKAESMTTASH